jgi:4-amino-4-deoxychorismate lyase
MAGLSVVVSLDGGVVDPSAPLLHADDLAAVRGDGIFETLLIRDGRPCLLEAHLARLTHSAQLMDLPAPDLPAWRSVIDQAVARWLADGGDEGVLRLVYSRGRESDPTGTAYATVGPLAPRVAEARRAGVGALTLDRGLASNADETMPWLVAGAKTLSYAVNMAAIREARRRGADDALFVSSDGFLLEGPTSSVVLRIGDRFVTPAPAGGILHGTTQLSLFAHLEERGFATAYETLRADVLDEVDAAWLVSSVRLAAPVTAIDARELAVDRELTASLNAYLLSPRD